MKSIKIDEQVILKKLESLGSRINLRAYRKSGAGEKTFGVSISNLRKLSKAMLNLGGSEEDLNALCKSLWASGYTEAKMLAIITCPKEQVTIAQLNQCADTIDFYALADLFVDELVMNTRFALELMHDWKQSDEEYRRKCAYRILKHLAESDCPLSSMELQEELYRIEKLLPGSANWAKLSMYEALVAIGKINRRLNTVAMAVSKRIGPVSVEFSPKNIKVYSADKVLSDRRIKKNLPE